jgi:hypothetical protein
MIRFNYKYKGYTAVVELILNSDLEWNVKLYMRSTDRKIYAIPLMGRNIFSNKDYAIDFAKRKIDGYVEKYLKTNRKM